MKKLNLKKQTIKQLTHKLASAVNAGKAPPPVVVLPDTNLWCNLTQYKCVSGICW